MIRTGERLYIRSFEIGDSEALLALMLRNRQLFEQVVPTRLDSFYTLDHQVSSIELWQQADKEGRRHSFGIFLKGTDELIGDASLFEIIRGPLQKATLGYCLDAAYNGKGYMTEAIHLVLDYAFGEAGLHRIETGAMPHNTGSIRVLEKVGFRQEGLARENVKIQGVWRDHVMFAILESDTR